MTFPFRGIVSERPYPETGLTTARWAKEVGVELVTFGELMLTQTGVVIPALFGVTERISDEYPHVVQYQGIRYLEDGHTRVVRAALSRGLRAMPMRVCRRG